MKRSDEKGMALVMVIILLVVLSVMATSLMFLSQTETWSSANYRLMTQARYGAEAGLNKAVNYLLNNYTAPATSGSDPLSNYALHATGTAFEGDNVGVTYNGHAVVLNTVSGSANYPNSATETAFASAAAGSLTADNTTINYSAHATLLSMVQVTPYGSTTPTTIQTWRVTGDASISGAASAQVEVSSILEQQITPVFTYAAFAASPNCAAMTFGGGGITGSYDSTAPLVGGVATIASSGGNVGTNGNLVTNGNPTTINGSLSTPRTGVGSCVNGSNVTAWTDNSGNVTGGVVELPQPIVYPTPTVNPPGSLDISLSGANCPSGASAIPGCIANSATHDIYIPPGSYGNIQISGQVNLHFSPGNYNINTFQESGNNTGLMIDSLPRITTPSWTAYPSTTAINPVVLQVTGSSSDSFTGNVITLTGNSVQNPGLNPMNFQMLYAGTGSVSLKGNSQASGLLYAPNASFSFAGGSTWYGAVIGQTMTDMGGAAIYYDRNLNNAGFTVSNFTLDTFSWKKY